MAYARFGPDSDVYVIEAGTGGWECCRCALHPPEQPEGYAAVIVLDTPGEMAEHLLAHRAAGHKVPQDSIDELLDEEARGVRNPPDPLP